MGEIAESMISGEVCEMCGVPLCEDCADMGIPMYCSEECAKDRGINMKDFGAEARICNH